MKTLINTLWKWCSIFFVIPVGVLLVVLIAPSWRSLSQFWKFVGPSKFSAFTILAGSVLLLATAQGKELVARVGDEGSPWFAFLAGAVVWLAIQAWYWARAVLLVSKEELDLGTLIFKSQTPSSVAPAAADRNWKTWLPEIYGGALYFWVLLFLFSGGYIKTGAVAGVLGAVGLVALWYRDPAASTLYAAQSLSGVEPVSPARREELAVAEAHRRGHSARNWKLWLPRVYALVPFAVADIALWAQGLGNEVVLISVAGVLTLGGLIFRRRTVAVLRKSIPTVKILTTQPEKNTSFVPVLDTPPANVGMFFFSIGLAIIAFFLVLYDPLLVGQTFGAAAIAFFALSVIIPIGSSLVWTSDRLGFPIITTLLIGAIVFSNWNNNHEVETVGNGENIDKRMSVSQAVAAWLDANPQQSSDETVPLVMVSTAGGGLRAAYWTATVLGALQDTCPQFRQRTFSISGVSGGSVGAAVFTARAGLLSNNEIANCTDEVKIGKVSTFSTRVLSEDFLGPTVAALMFPDLMQRFLPVPLLRGRGKVLADAWALAWERTCGSDSACKQADAQLFDAPFLSFGPRAGSDNWRPALFLNATHQESGKRFISGHLKVTRDVFFDAFDSHNILQRDVTLKTAALNSARFTYVSPPGLLKDPNEKKLGHVLDGGYFENNGAVTSAELLLKVLEVLDGQGRKVQPIIIQITSDPGLDADDYPVPPVKGAALFLPMNGEVDAIGNEVLGPIRGILATRVARGVLAAKTLAEIVELMNDKKWIKIIENPVFAHFEMCVETDDPRPPLGWAMSSASRDQLGAMLMSGPKPCDNKAELAKVLNALNGKPALPKQN